jgi:hypothetical protein
MPSDVEVRFWQKKRGRNSRTTTSYITAIYQQLSSLMANRTVKVEKIIKRKLKEKEMER